MHRESSQMTKETRVNQNLVGIGNPCFVIAEAGVNHNGDLEKAIELASVAHRAGADAVKFQLFNIEEQVSKFAESAPYQRKGAGQKTMTEMAKAYDLPWEDHRVIAQHCKQLGITYMASCFDSKAVDFLIHEIGTESLKVGSGEITNYPLLRHMAQTGKLILLSTGMCTLKDVAGAVDQIQSTGDSSIILLHCVSSYPALEEDVNLRAMTTLQEQFNMPVGYSDHTRGETAAIAAVTLGAVTIEKHFTIDNTLLGPDHAMSLNPRQLEKFVQAIRRTEALLGDGVKKPTKAEKKMQTYARRSIVASTSIKANTLLTPSNITLKRPATGIDPRSWGETIGRKTIVDISKDQPITLDMLQ